MEPLFKRYGKRTTADMKLYYWRGTAPSGDAIRGRLQAADRSSAVKQLQSQGVSSIQLIVLPYWGGTPSPTQITLLIRQLSTLLSSGLTLARSLEGTIQGLPATPLRRLGESMLLELKQGQPFSTILASHPQLFDPFLIHLVRSGEQSSQLPLLLERAAEHRERMRTLKRQSWKAISYPLGVLVFTVGISLFLLLQVVPQFETMFHNLGGELPALTQHLLRATHFLQQHTATLLLSLLLFPILLYLSYRHFTPLQQSVDSLLLKLPLIGTTLQEIMVARLGRTLATLQQAAVPLHAGLESALSMTQLLPFQQAIQQVHDALHQGTSLSEAAKQYRLFPPIAIQMIQAGEESGELAQMLDRLASYYEGEVEHRIQQLTSLLEPLLILLIGGLVGVLAVALYQPIFQMGHQL
mgnify:FL=1